MRFNDESVRYFIPDTRQGHGADGTYAGVPHPFDNETGEYTGLSEAEISKLAVDDDKRKKYSGGLVFEPKVDAYMESPVTNKDYAALYPRAEIENNICYCTMIKLAQIEQYGMDPRRDVNKIPVKNTPNNAGIGEVDPANPRVRVLCFVREHVRHGILPQILLDLLGARKRTRDEMKKCDMSTPEGRGLHMVLDSKQLAQKVTCNAVYGFTGARDGYLPLREIALVTTTFGVAAITYTRDLVENMRIEVHIDDPERVRKLQPSFDHEAFTSMDPELCITSDNIRIIANVENRFYLTDFETYMHEYYYPIAEVGEYAVENPKQSIVALYGDTDSAMVEHSRYHIVCPDKRSEEIMYHEKRLRRSHCARISHRCRKARTRSYVHGP